MPGKDVSCGAKAPGAALYAGSPSNHGDFTGDPSPQPDTSPHILYADGHVNTSPSVQAALRKTGLAVARFKNVQGCLGAISRHRCRLVVSNSPQPDIEAIELLNRVQHVAPWLPVIVLVDHGAIATAIRVMKAGALDCLERPPEPRYLRAAVNAALRKSAQHREPLPLSDVEKCVLQHLMRGQTNRQIANDLHRSQRTIEVHRSDIIRKLGAEGPVDLMRRAAAAGLLDL